MTVEEDFLRRLLSEPRGVTTRQDLVDAIDTMIAGCEAGDVDEKDVGGYLEAFLLDVHSIGGFCLNDEDPKREQPTWAWLGKLLSFALHHD